MRIYSFIKASGISNYTKKSSWRLSSSVNKNKSRLLTCNRRDASSFRNQLKQIEPYDHNSDGSNKLLRHTFIRRPFSTNKDPELINVSRFTSRNDYLEKITSRILNAKVGTLNTPSIHESSVAISLWHSEVTKDKNEYASLQAEKLLSRLLEEFNYDPSSAKVEITTETINQVLDSLRIVSNAQVVSHPKRHDPFITISKKYAQHCHDTLQKMCSLGIDKTNPDDQYGQNNIKIQSPDVKSFNIVMDSFAKLGLVDEANALFEDMILKSNNHLPQCRPNTITYNSLISTYANINTPSMDDAHKAEKTLNSMMELYLHTNNPDVKPDIISFSSVIAAYANSAQVDPKAVDDAERILKQMVNLYTSSLVQNGGDDEWIHLKPNIVVITSVMDAFAKSRYEDSPQRVSDILDYMQGIFNFHDMANVESMTSLMNVFSKSGREDSFERTEAILYQMISIAEQTGNMEWMPTNASFTALLDSLAQSLSRKFYSNGYSLAMQGEGIVKRMEEMYQNGNDRVQPTTITYNALINVWSKANVSESGTRAEEILDKMEMSDSDRDSLKPDSVTYTSVIDAYANCVNDKKLNGFDAERILLRMIEKYRNDVGNNVVPTTFAFSAVINAYAKNGEPKEAERIIKTMRNLYDEGMETAKPDSYCLNGVIHAYANSALPDRDHHVLEFLKVVEEYGLADTITYTTVIECLSKSGKLGSERQAHELLKKMAMMYDKGNVQIKPTNVTYNSVMNAYLKSRLKSASDEVLSLLTQLENRYNQTKDDDFKPSNVTYNVCLSTLAKHPNRKNIECMEEMIEKMKSEYKNGNHDLKPDAFSMTSLISAWAYSTEESGAVRAEDLLQQMQQMYEDGDTSMKPTIVTFGAVLKAWSRRKNPERAQAIFHHMKALYKETKDDEIRANTVIYNTLIHAWANHGADGISHAESLLQEMEGNTGTSPNVITYNSILHAYKWDSSDNALDKAEKVFHRMEMNKPDEGPTVVSYTSLLNVIARSTNPLKIIKAEELLSKMEQNAQGSKNQSLEPNNFTYDAVLRTCNQPPNKDPKTIRQALILAVKTFTKMQASKQVHPSSYSYNIFFSIISKLTSGQEYERLLEKALSDCTKDGVLDDKIIDNLHKTAPWTLVQKVLRTSANPGTLKLKDLPSEWSKFIDSIPTARSQRITERARHDTGRNRIR